MIGFEGPSDDVINRVLSSLQREVEDEIARILKVVGSGAVAVLSRAYQSEVYETPPGVFGRPKDDGKPLAQAVQLEEASDHVTVFTNKREAVYVEFGTGIFATIGGKGPIRAKNKRFLAFPVWRIPEGFGGAFLPREKAKEPIPFGAIGLVFAKRVAGMKPRRVWTNPAVESAILRILDRELKESRLT